jgi:hypothetical protein
MKEQEESKRREAELGETQVVGSSTLQLPAQTDGRFDMTALSPRKSKKLGDKRKTAMMSEIALPKMSEILPVIMNKQEGEHSELALYSTEPLPDSLLKKDKDQMVDSKFYKEATEELTFAKFIGKIEEE